MTKYIIRRLLVSIPVLFAMALATFLLVQALPGGPFSFVGTKAMPEYMRNIMERRYGLDKPLYQQFFMYLGRLAQGDLGPIMRNRSQNVNDVVAQSMPVSFQVGIIAVAFAFLLGIPMGIIAALNRNTFLDYFATFLAVLGRSIPNIVLAPALILIFGVYLKWFPIAFWGSDPPFILGFLPQPSLKFVRHAVLPVATLASGMAAGIARLTRAGLLEVLDQDYIRTARSKGLREYVVIVRHALKNSMIPIATSLGPLLAAVLTGTFVIEQVFALNGLGRQFIGSVGSREYFLLTSITLLYGLFLVVGNLLVDVMYAWLDPRIRYD